MLLELYTPNHKKAGIITAAQCHICKLLENGDESLECVVAETDPDAEAIRPEAYVRTPDQEYTIKQVQRTTENESIKLNAALNVESLQGHVWPGGFESVEQPIQTVIGAVLEGTGWTAIVPEEITKKRTIRQEGDTTTWEVLKSILSTYRVEMSLNTLRKVCTITSRRGTDCGVYAIEGLDLTKLGIKKSSYGFYTRLIPIGKDGLHLWENDKNYLENHQYTDKVITSIWHDDRYTNSAALLEDATARLEEASKPAVAYTAKLKNFTNGKRPDVGDTIRLASATLGVQTKQRIVKLDHWPDDTNRDQVELSNVKQSFAVLQKRAQEAAQKETVSVINRKLLNDYSTKKEITTAIKAESEALKLEVSKKYTTQTQTESIKSAIDVKVGEIALTVDATSNAANILEHKHFESNGGSENYKIESGIATLKIQSGKSYRITEAIKPELLPTATGKVFTISGYYKVIKPFKASSIKLQWMYTGSENVSLVVHRDPIVADKESDSWTYYEVRYSDPLPPGGTMIGMSCIVDADQDDDGIIQWKDWAFCLSGPVQENNARSAFAMDPNNVTISSGHITFDSNSIVINSKNFKLDAKGNVQASGSFVSENAEGWKAVVRAGAIEMFYQGERKITIFKDIHSGNGYVELRGANNKGDTKSLINPHRVHFYGTENCFLGGIGSDNNGVHGDFSNIKIKNRGQNANEEFQAQYTPSTIGIWKNNEPKVLIDVNGAQFEQVQCNTLNVKKMAIGSAAQDVRWCWSATLSGYILTTSESLK